ncbi:MAG: SDR family NAD(P)-dependent oxidoreductase [Gammaproteobacteria bacterium]|nr:SDR family NAD(P)-dependent oxidoreductase [Gammaproteobacteria bacterium]
MTRWIVITGCSSGIGRAAAVALAARGYEVIATARREADLEALRAAGLHPVHLDLADEHSVAAACAAIAHLTGGVLDAVVNNAAFALPGAVEDLSRAAMRTQFEANVFGTIDLTNRLLPLLERSDKGRIVMISSILGLVAMRWRGAYNASKFALEGFVQSMRLELRDRNIKVITINPGPIESRFRLNAQQQADRHVDMQNSRHAERYAGLRKEREQEDGKIGFSQPPQAVVARIVTAIESKHPALRYLVTGPAHWLTWLKRLLPERWLDALLARIS